MIQNARVLCDSNDIKNIENQMLMGSNSFTIELYKNLIPFSANKVLQKELAVEVLLKDWQR